MQTLERTCVILANIQFLRCTKDLLYVLEGLLFVVFFHRLFDSEVYIVSSSFVLVSPINVSVVLGRSQLPPLSSTGRTHSRTPTFE